MNWEFAREPWLRWAAGSSLVVGLAVVAVVVVGRAAQPEPASVDIAPAPASTSAPELVTTSPTPDDVLSVADSGRSRPPSVTTSSVEEASPARRDDAPSQDAGRRAEEPAPPAESPSVHSPPTASADEPGARGSAGEPRPAPIAMDPLPDRRLDESPFVVAAAAPDDLDVRYAATTRACRLSGASVELVTIGTCRIEVSHRGSTDRLPDATVREFVVSRGRQVLDFPGPGTIPYAEGGLELSLRADASSGLDVVFERPGWAEPACTVSSGGAFRFDSWDLGLPVSCAVTARQDGNADWLPAEPVTVEFVVTYIENELTWTIDPARHSSDDDRRVGKAVTAEVLGAGSRYGRSAIFGSETPAVCRVAGQAGADRGRLVSATISLIDTGSCTLVVWAESDEIYIGSGTLTSTFDVAGAQSGPSDGRSE